MRFIYTKAFAIFSTCLVVGALLVILQIKGLLDPVKTVLLNSPKPIISGFKAVTHPIKGFFSTVYRLRTIVRENNQLSEKVLQLEQQVVDYNRLSLENQALRSELGFSQATKLNLVPCTVLNQNPSGLTSAITLNCGSGQGVTAGMAIIASGHLVGKVVYSGNGLSTALLITSSDFSSDASLSQSGAVGVVRGSFGSGVILDQLSQHEVVQKGWLVTTAGINSQIPKDILIGEIGDELSSQNDLFKKTTVVSPVDFNNLEFVFAVK